MMRAPFRNERGFFYSRRHGDNGDAANDQRSPHPILIVLYTTIVHRIIASSDHCIISVLLFISSSLIYAAHPPLSFSIKSRHLPISCTFPTSYEAGVFGSTKVR